MLTLEDHKALGVYSKLLHRKDFNLSLRYDWNGNLDIMVASHDLEEVNVFSKVIELEDWFTKKNLNI